MHLRIFLAFAFATCIPAVGVSQGKTDLDSIKAKGDVAFKKAVQLHKEGKHAESIVEFQKVFELTEVLCGKDDLRTANAAALLGAAQYRAKRLRDAEITYRRVLAIREAKLGKDHLQVGQALNDL